MKNQDILNDVSTFRDYTKRYSIEKVQKLYILGFQSVK